MIRAMILLLLSVGAAQADAYAVLDKTGIVQNVIELDAAPKECPYSDGCTILLFKDVAASQLGKFAPPVSGPSDAIKQQPANCSGLPTLGFTVVDGMVTKC